MKFLNNQWIVDDKVSPETMIHVRWSKKMMDQQLKDKEAINCNKLWNNTNVKLNSGWSWTLKLIIEKIGWTNVETKRRKEIATKKIHKHTRFGYVPNDRKKIFQDYRCRNACNHWMMGII
jgi:hypothetical protein